MQHIEIRISLNVLDGAPDVPEHCLSVAERDLYKFPSLVDFHDLRLHADKRSADESDLCADLDDLRHIDQPLITLQPFDERKVLSAKRTGAVLVPQRFQNAGTAPDRIPFRHRFRIEKDIPRQQPRLCFSDAARIRLAANRKRRERRISAAREIIDYKSFLSAFAEQTVTLHSSLSCCMDSGVSIIETGMPDCQESALFLLKPVAVCYIL